MLGPHEVTGDSGAIQLPKEDREELRLLTLSTVALFDESELDLVPKLKIKDLGLLPKMACEPLWKAFPRKGDSMYEPPEPSRINATDLCTSSMPGLDPGLFQQPCNKDHISSLRPDLIAVGLVGRFGRIPLVCAYKTSESWLISLKGRSPLWSSKKSMPRDQISDCLDNTGGFSHTEISGAYHRGFIGGRGKSSFDLTTHSVRRNLSPRIKERVHPLLCVWIV